MSSNDPPRPPRSFSLDDKRLDTPLADPLAPLDEPSINGPAEMQTKMPVADMIAARRKGIRWGAIFLSALGGLISLALSLWAANFVAQLFAESGWLGTLALILLTIAAFAALMITLREIAGFFRLARIASLRLQSDSALANGDKKRALSVSRDIEKLFAAREELAWGLRRLAEHKKEILDARELLILTEREILAPLDIEAKRIITATVRRVAMITAASPSAIVDVGFVAIANLGMLRRLAAIYGGRPGFLGSLRLARLVLGHLALTGGVALGDDLLQQLIGHGLTARLSARLGEGVLNGAFTGRIGIAAIELCRPLPFIEAERPRLRDFLAALRIGRG